MFFLCEQYWGVCLILPDVSFNIFITLIKISQIVVIFDNLLIRQNLMIRLKYLFLINNQTGQYINLFIDLCLQSINTLLSLNNQATACYVFRHTLSALDILVALNFVTVDAQLLALRIELQMLIIYVGDVF